MAKNSKRDKNPDGGRSRYSETRTDDTNVKTDSVAVAKRDSSYSLRAQSRSHIITILFIRQPGPNDSLSYLFDEEENGISEDDEKSLSNYLKVSKQTRIVNIHVKHLLNKNERGRHEQSTLKFRAKRIVKFLSNEGVDKSIVIPEP